MASKKRANFILNVSQNPPFRLGMLGQTLDQQRRKIMPTHTLIILKVPW